ncbi:hypothetical protein GGI07_000082 [Coemansia sp. Benny D115]|nr:hypothetical protein GGI07_000082 [Coemansia sp. Benny D115]
MGSTNTNFAGNSRTDSQNKQEAESKHAALGASRDSLEMVDVQPASMACGGSSSGVSASAVASASVVASASEAKHADGSGASAVSGGGAVDRAADVGGDDTVAIDVADGADNSPSSTSGTEGHQQQQQQSSQADGATTAEAAAAAAGADAEAPEATDGAQPEQETHRPTTWLGSIRLGFSLLSAMQKIIAGIVVLALSASQHEEDVDKFRLYVILNIVRLFLYYPLYINRKVHCSGSTWPNARMATHLTSVRNFLSLAAFAIFVYGNHCIYNDDGVRETAPLLYNISVAYVILGYLYFALPVIVLVLTIVVFVILFALVPSFRMKFTKKRGADFSQISQIPLVKYVEPRLHLPLATASSPPSLHNQRLSVHDEPAPEPSAPGHTSIYTTPACLEAAHSTTSLHSNPERRRRSVSRIHILNPFARVYHRLTRSRRQRAAELEEYKKQLSNPVEDFTPRDPEDSMCAICLCDYEDGDILRLLPCKHHMHQACVDEWLHINKSCPLCKREAISNAEESTDAAAAATAAEASEAEDMAEIARSADTAASSASSAGENSCAPAAASSAEMESVSLPGTNAGISAA